MNLLNLGTFLSMPLALVAFQAQAYDGTMPVNLIENGSFERNVVDTGKYESFSGGQKLGNWRVFAPVEGGGVDVAHERFFDDEAPDGKNVLDLCSWDTGGISQRINVEPGANYELKFAYANNPLEGQDHTFSALVTVTSGGSLNASATVANNDSAMGSLKFKEYSLVFTANGPTADITLLSMSTVSRSGILVDNIRVTKVSDQP